MRFRSRSPKEVEDKISEQIELGDYKAKKARAISKIKLDNFSRKVQAALDLLRKDVDSASSPEGEPTDGADGQSVEVDPGDR